MPAGLRCASWGSMTICAAAAGLALSGESACAQLRIAAWNITSYGGGRQADLRTAVYGVFNGRSMAPDILLVQEALDASALSSTTPGDEGLLQILNGASGSPGDWAAAPFLASPDSACVALYRTSKVQFLGVKEIAVADPGTTGQPRDTTRFDFRPVGYNAASASLGIYNIHLKAGEGSADGPPNNNERRLAETRRIRSNIQGEDTNPTAYPNDGLPAGYQAIVAGDFNVQTSTQTAYQMLVAASPGGTTSNGNTILPSSRVYDPINRPGSWNNSNTYRMLHTQDPVGSGGMDDRHDQILVGGGLLDGQGLEYIGVLNGPQNPVAWNLNTFNDPNHSYRVWGNDGTSFNAQLTVAGNAWVGATIAQALRNIAMSGGHLPVYIDLRVPAKVVSPTIVNFGSVQQGSSAQQSIIITNGGDTALWTAAGVDALDYTLGATAGFTVPAGPFIEGAGGGGNSHTITMNTAVAGQYNGTLTITSDDPDQPIRLVQLVGEVIPDGPANLPPTADAGGDIWINDQDNNGAEVVGLDGSASFDSDGFITNYAWRLGTTPIGGGASPTANVFLPVGVYTISLTVTDNDGATDVDTLAVTVNDRPVAAAGADFLVTDVDGDAEEIVEVDASASTDVIGGIVSYRWSLGTTILADETLPVTQIVLPIGVNAVTLTVTDAGGAVHTDTVVVTVNAAPLADAGPDQTLIDGDSSGDEVVVLDGSSSSDAEGPIASWQWRLGGDLIATGVTPAVVLPLGVHEIELTVTDASGATGTDTVVITVRTCAADWNQDGGVDDLDIAAFFASFEAGEADVNEDGGVDDLDILAFFSVFETGC